MKKYIFIAFPSLYRLFFAKFVPKKKKKNKNLSHGLRQPKSNFAAEFEN